jgi:hypothetical protein
MTTEAAAGASRKSFPDCFYGRSVTSASPLLGPSTAEFQPGVLNGTADPQLYQRSTTYNPSRINPAPNFGFAWNPTVQGGLLGKLLGGQ